MDILPPNQIRAFGKREISHGFEWRTFEPMEEYYKTQSYILLLRLSKVKVYSRKDL